MFLEWKTKRPAASSKTGWGGEKKYEVQLRNRLKIKKKKKKKNQVLLKSSHENLKKPSSQQKDTVQNILSEFGPDVSQVNLWLIKWLCGGENPLRNSYCCRVDWQLANDLSGETWWALKNAVTPWCRLSGSTSTSICILSVRPVHRDELTRMSCSLLVVNKVWWRWRFLV